MAEKRMFSKKITDSDAFIELSSSAQALYFHLNQGADDDGFNNQIQNAIFKAHATIDDLKVLMMKNFIIRFDSGVIVIKHWRIHNTLRKDRYKETNFNEELNKLKIKENGSYTLRDDVGCQTVAKWLPQYSIDKNSIDNIYAQNDNSNNENENLKDEQINDWENKFNKFYSQYPKKVSKQLVRKWFEKNKPNNELFEVMINSLEVFKKTKDWLKDNGQFIPYPSTWLNQRRWEDEIVTQQKKTINDPIEYKVLNTDEMTEEEYMKMIRGD